MKTSTLAATFAACLLTAPAAMADETQNLQQSFNPEATATIIFYSQGMIHPIQVEQTFANMQQCIEDMDAEAADFAELRDTDIIGSNDRFTYICEDEQRIVTATFTRFGGEQRHTHFKP
jgi:hypothetical protein